MGGDARLFPGDGDLLFHRVHALQVGQQQPPADAPGDDDWSSSARVTGEKRGSRTPADTALPAISQARQGRVGAVVPMQPRSWSRMCRDTKAPAAWFVSSGGRSGGSWARALPVFTQVSRASRASPTQGSSPARLAASRAASAA